MACEWSYCCILLCAVTGLYVSSLQGPWTGGHAAESIRPPSTQANQPKTHPQKHLHLTLPPQISAITPFQIISALAFGFTVYGMGGLRPGAQAVFRSGFINTMMYLIASQVGGGVGVGVGGVGRGGSGSNPLHDDVCTSSRCREH
jgi:hypothetical protein